MSRIVVAGVSKRIGGRLLFDGVSLTFNRGHRYGLTGPNGAGKSTFLKMIMGFEECSGDVSLPAHVGYLRQDLGPYRSHTLLDVVMMGKESLWEVHCERESLYAGEMTEETGMRLGEVEEAFSHEGGYSAPSDAAALLTGIGIPDEMHEKRMEQIPQDLQFKAMLCQALFGGADALILDEPTNHLDLFSIQWLEKFLLRYEGVLIVTSHDRHFLDAVTTDTSDIDYETIILYPGNYSQMVKSKVQIRSSAERDVKTREKQIARLNEFIARFSAGTRASSVRSRAKEVEKLTPQELQQSNIQRPYIRFPQAQPSGATSLKVKRVSKGFGHPLFEKLQFELHRGDRLGIIGNNGVGKTTLMNIIAGALEPDHGEVCLGHNVQLGYMPQEHESLLREGNNMTLFDFLKTKKQGLYDEEVRAVLGRLLFSGDDAFKTLNVLSGGERARLILATLMLQEPNLLLLDEPNNHLDLESVSALAEGLSCYEGTVILVGHDRHLMDKVATKILSFEEGSFPRLYQGPLEEYIEDRDSR